MHSTTTKTTKPAPAVQHQPGPTFFRKAGEESFFGPAKNPAFFGAPIQSKLTVSTPDDPHEKEADAVADKVMRMKDPVLSPVIPGKKIEKVQRKEKEEENVQPKREPLVINSIHCKEDSGKRLQAKLNFVVQRKEEKTSRKEQANAGESGKDHLIDTKNISLHHSDVIQQSGRGPPTSSIPFEQTLASSKGGGSALPEDTRQTMEGRFQADFSGVRIHTGSTAENLSSSIHAQAFAHGNDIYFNSGKFSPNTTEGGTLLAHELTHTIQQGASKTIAPSSQANPAIAEKNTTQHSDEPGVSSKTENKPVKENTTDIKAIAVNGDGKLVRTNGPGVQQKEDVEQQQQKTKEPDPVQPKPVLKKVTVEPPVSVNASPAVSVEPVNADKELSKKEEEQNEDKEKQPAGGDHLVHKKTADERSIDAAANRDNSYTLVARHSVQRSLHSEPPVRIDQSPITQQADAVKERGPPIQQMTTGSRKRVQRAIYDAALANISSLISVTDIPWDLEEAKVWLKGKLRTFASYIPGYKAVGVVLGSDPITGEEIAQNGRNFIEAALDIIPGGNLLKQKLEEIGLIDKAAAWIDGQLATLKGLISTVRSEFMDEYSRLGLGTITDGVMDTVRRFGGIFERAINNLITFAKTAAKELLEIVKKFLLDQIVDFVKKHTNAYDLLKVILERDPITDEKVERNGTNILNALLALGGDAGKEQKKQMDETGTFQKAAAWIDKGISVFGDLYSAIRSNFGLIWDVVSIDALMHPVDTFTKIYDTFAAPVKRVLDFVTETLGVILGFIKEALMVKLSAWAQTVRGYKLVTVILKKDPFTGAVVPRTVENLIHGFMSLMDGGEAQFQQMKESGAIAKAEQKINAAVAKLNMTPEYVIQLFKQLWDDFKFTDLVNPIEAFKRIIDKFGEPIGRLIAFVIEIVKIVVEVILIIMQFPFDLINNIMAKAMQAFEKIKADPIGFLKNLLRAIKEGFVQFFNNILKHLLAGLTGWLMSELKDANVTAPKDFTLGTIIGWVLELLGISMEKIWEKLAKHPKIGQARVTKIRGMISKLEGIWTFIKDVQERGMAAIWDKIVEKLNTLWDTVLDAIKNWIMEQIVVKIVTKLLSMLDPTGIMAVVNSAIALYKAIQSFKKYMLQILQIVNSFVEGLAEIASGNTKKAADFLESTLARGVPVVIGFLANQVGLSGVGKKVGEMIEKVRDMVDKALTWLVNKAVDTGMNLLDKVMGKGSAADPLSAVKQDLHQAEAPYLTNGGIKQQEAQTVAEGVARRNNTLVSSIQVVDGGIRWNYNIVQRTQEEGPKKEEAAQEDDRFIKILHDAIVQLGNVDLAGAAPAAAAPAVASQSAREADTDRARQAASATGSPATTGAGASPIQDPRKQQMLENITRVHREILGAYSSFQTAARANRYPANTFSVGSAKFFVIRTNANYIAPNREAGPRRSYYFPSGADLNSRIADEVARADDDYLRMDEQFRTTTNDTARANFERRRNNALNKSTELSIVSRGTPEEKLEYAQKSKDINKNNEELQIGIPNEMVNKYDYGSNASLISVEKGKQLFETFPGQITEDTTGTLFVAGLVVEPSRRSEAHISNILLLDPRSEFSPAEQKSSVFGHLPMTQPGSFSDPTIPGTGASRARERAPDPASFEADPRITQPARPTPPIIKAVVDRNLAAVRRHPELHGGLLSYYQQNNTQPDPAIQAEFQKRIKSYLKP